MLSKYWQQLTDTYKRHFHEKCITSQKMTYKTKTVQTRSYPVKTKYKVKFQ